jgi:hypothetical protein
MHDLTSLVHSAHLSVTFSVPDPVLGIRQHKRNENLSLKGLTSQRRADPKPAEWSVHMVPMG